MFKKTNLVQRLSPLPPFVVGRNTLVAADHVTTHNMGGKRIWWVGGVAGICCADFLLCAVFWYKKVFLSHGQLAELTGIYSFVHISLHQVYVSLYLGRCLSTVP